VQLDGDSHIGWEVWVAKYLSHVGKGGFPGSELCLWDASACGRCVTSTNNILNVVEVAVVQKLSLVGFVDDHDAEVSPRCRLLFLVVFGTDAERVCDGVFLLVSFDLLRDGFIQIDV